MQNSNYFLALLIRKNRTERCYKAAARGADLHSENNHNKKKKLTSVAS